MIFFLFHIGIVGKCGWIIGGRGGAKEYVGPPSQIIGGAWPLWPPSSYVYECSSWFYVYARMSLLLSRFRCFHVCTMSFAFYYVLPWNFQIAPRAYYALITFSLRHSCDILIQVHALCVLILSARFLECITGIQICLPKGVGREDKKTRNWVALTTWPQCWCWCWCCLLFLLCLILLNNKRTVCVSSLGKKNITKERSDSVCS